MIDVIVYKPSPYGLMFIHDNTLGFIIYHIKQERVYVSYKTFHFAFYFILHLGTWSRKEICQFLITGSIFHNAPIKGEWRYHIEQYRDIGTFYFSLTYK